MDESTSSITKKYPFFYKQYDTFINYISSSKKYLKSLLDFIYENDIKSEELTKKDFTYLKALIASVEMLMIKDSIIENYSFITNSTDIKEYLKECHYLKDGGSIEVDKVKFTNCDEFIGYIRNAIAHGNYYIDGNSFAFIQSKDSISGEKTSFKIYKISIDNLYNIVKKCIFSYLYGQNPKNYKKNLYISTPNIEDRNIKRIVNSVYDNLYSLTLSLESEDNIDIKTINGISLIKPDYNCNNCIKDIRINYLKNIEKYLRDNKLDGKIKVSTNYQKENVPDNLKNYNYIINNKNNIGENDSQRIKKYLVDNYIMNRTYNDIQKNKTSDAENDYLLHSISVLDKLYYDINQKLYDNIEENDFLPIFYNYYCAYSHMDRMMLFIICLYARIVYFIDKLEDIDKDNDLYKNIKQELFDIKINFINLNNLSQKKDIYEKSCIEYTNKKNEFHNDTKKGLIKIIKKHKLSISTFSNIIKMLKHNRSKYKIVKSKKSEMTKAQKNYKESIQFYNSSYYFSRELLENIRNSIAHFNYYVEPRSDAEYITFRDFFPKKRDETLNASICMNEIEQFINDIDLGIYDIISKQKKEHIEDVEKSEKHK